MPGPRTRTRRRRRSRRRCGGKREPERTLMPDNRPIGVFDSGVGGLTVARAILDLLPNEPMVYVGDSARYPYGPRPLEEIRRFALEITDELVRRDVKMIVVACN